IRRLPSSPLFPYTTLFRSQRAVLAQQLGRHLWVDPHQEGLRAAMLAAVDQVAKAAHDLDRHGLLGLDHALAVTRRAPLGEDLPRSEEHTSELQSRFDLVCR